MDPKSKKEPCDLLMPRTAYGAPPQILTPDQHKIRHINLHRALDELVADWLLHVGTVFAAGKTLSMSSIMDLMEWSYTQTQEPTEPKE